MPSVGGFVKYAGGSSRCPLYGLSFIATEVGNGLFADIHFEASAPADRELMSPGQLDHGIGLNAHNDRNTQLCWSV
jgi:hypothetical protein